MRVLKRVLTRKSILGFGYAENRDLSVQMILDLGRKNLLIDSYYGLEKIDFVEDILNELGITKEFRLQKPAKDFEMRALFYTQLISKEREEIPLLERRASYYRNRKDNNIKAKRSEAQMNFQQKKEFLRSKNQW